ncbi:hypothetical protein [Massilia sp. TWR1-2-2]|uniref:hypothetical protein n=1 Tax=Massilia sp. TWR1-2-2 TaxID=2804584 RepID=UPI003CEFEA21
MPAVSKSERENSTDAGIDRHLTEPVDSAVPNRPLAGLTCLPASRGSFRSVVALAESSCYPVEASQARVASTLSWLIAMVAASTSFFNWQKAWQLYTQSQLTLQFALTEWEARTAEARCAASEEEALKILKAALQQLTKVAATRWPMRRRNILTASKCRNSVRSTRDASLIECEHGSGIIASSPSTREHPWK